MSVPVSKRTLSQYEFYNTAVRLRTKVSEWLLRDLGAKPRVRDLSFVGKRYKMSDEDRAVLDELFDKYGFGDRLCATFPEWWIAERRRTLDGICSEMVLCIVKAFNLYPQNIEEWNHRRELQNKSIGCAYALLEEMKFVVDCLHKTTGVEVNKFMPFVEMCETEIGLLKGWRKQGNEIRKPILRKEIGDRMKIEKQLSEKSSKK